MVHIIYIIIALTHLVGIIRQLIYLYRETTNHRARDNQMCNYTI